MGKTEDQQTRIEKLEIEVNELKRALLGWVYDKGILWPDSVLSDSVMYSSNKPNEEKEETQPEEALVDAAYLEIYRYFREGANVWICGYEKKIKRTLRKFLSK